MISRREAAIITAYTGITLGDFDAFQEYVTEKMGGVVSIQLASQSWWDRLHELSKDDFLALEIESVPQVKPPKFPGKK